MDEAERLCDRVAIVDHGRVIALGTPRDLIAQTGAEHVVHFSIAGDALAADPLAADRLDPAALPTLDGVLAARRTATGYELHVSAVHRAIPALLGALEQRGIGLTELRTHSPTLEDVFVGLTGRELRDE
jgi:ABC-2 type transport system ATP-binding protein